LLGNFGYPHFVVYDSKAPYNPRWP
jgi:hypothetical protein